MTATAKRASTVRTQSPRSGGRTAGRQSSTDRRTGAAYPTAGSAALKTEATTAAPTRQPRKQWLTVAPPAPVSVPKAPFVALLLLVVVGGVLGILMVNTKIMENAFQMKSLQAQQATLDHQEQDLRGQISYYESPNNLAAAAARLGLVRSNDPAIQLPNGKTIRVPVPPSAPREPSHSTAAKSGSQAAPVSNTSVGEGNTSGSEAGITNSNESQAGR